MQPKLNHIRRLIADGFDLDEIDSDHGAVEVRLKRGLTRATVRLLPSEAATLLLGPPPRQRGGIRR